MYATIPANIAYGPLSTLIALYILALGGGVLDVAYAITLSSIIIIPASLFWGKITDFYNKRKSLILLSYIGLAISFLLLFITKSVPGVIGIYVIQSFLITASSAPLSLL